MSFSSLVRADCAHRFFLSVTSELIAIKMKPALLLICSFLIIHASAEKEACLDGTQECHSTDYQSYVDCVRGRHKRSTDCSSCDSGNCIDTCNECDCDSCNYNNCQSGCGSCCNTCCSNYVSCRTNHCCHKTCHAQCESSSCRSQCRKNCFSSVSKDKEIIVTDHGERIVAGSSTDIKNENKPNITTIIHLNNVINNTNVVDIPIVLNNTNTQNISLYNQEYGGVQGSSQVEKCCSVIGPRQCVSKPKPKCFHYRSKQCGEFCTASIVHKEQQKVCESICPGCPPNCRLQVIYIPQPQPKCVYQSVWPYVACGIQKSDTCNGCYSHYVDQFSTAYMSCPHQCYDQGYGIGPMYRQGPFYQPTYSHVPCYQCLGLQNPYGGYGIPAYGGLPGYSGGDPVYGGVPVYGDAPAYGGVPAYGGFGEIPLYQQGPPIGYPIVDMNSNGSTPLFPDGQQLNPQFIMGNIPFVDQTHSLEAQRGQREIEIEVNYEPPSDAQAEVTIKKGRETGKNVTNTVPVAKKDSTENKEAA
ncbi:hypothetical protein JTB14_027340 [Gonioctena quinquepunctata]|nr:hypothetical protein JTB14_027340 [Gonioctena quinquepunctata]